MIYNCCAQSLSSQELINHAKQYDGQMVVYSGEAVGDLMRRGEFCWLNLNDGQNAVGVWLPLAMAQAVQRTGSYKTTGDTVEVSGVFHRACLEHGGDLDIHAQTLRLITAGAARPERIGAEKVKLLAAFAASLVLIWIFSRLRRA